MNIKTFKTIDEATNFLLVSPLKVNEFFPKIRELEEKHITKVNDLYLLVDIFGLLD